MTINRSECSHVFTVSPSRGEPGDPVFPIVVCPHCMTRWNGHLEDAVTTPPTDALISSAARDAILLGQDRLGVRLIREELGLVEEDAMRPNCMVGISSAGVPARVTADVGVQIEFPIIISSAPQREFMPTHLLIDQTCARFFRVLDILIGSQSMNVNSEPVPGTAYACSIRGELRISAGAMSNIGAFEIDGLHNVDLQPFVVNGVRATCMPGMRLRIFVENLTIQMQPFHAWFLGRCLSPPDGERWLHTS